MRPALAYAPGRSPLHRAPAWVTIVFLGSFAFVAFAFSNPLVLLADGAAVRAAPGLALADSDLAPPVVRLGRLAGWDPLPLSVRDARRTVGPLRAQLAATRPPRMPSAAAPAPTGPPLLLAEDLVVRYGDLVALRSVDLAVPAGQVLAVMGRNGSGKSSLLWALHPSGRRHDGSVVVAGQDPADVRPSLVGLVPQTPSDLLYLATVAEECTQADREAGRPGGSCRRLLDRLVPGLVDDHHPRDLSEGQRLGLVLAVQLTSAPSVVLLDEPTRGLDHLAKARLAVVLRELAAGGRVLVVATHDVEFVAAVAHRVLVLADGEVVADGPTADVVVSSPAFAPQVAKVFHPDRWLTVDEVAGALAGAGGTR